MHLCPFSPIELEVMQVALPRKLLTIFKLGAFLLFTMLVWGGTSQGQGQHRLSLIEQRYFWSSSFPGYCNFPFIKGV